MNQDAPAPALRRMDPSLPKPTGLSTRDFAYDLQEELIAQVPAADRDASRLLVFHRATGRSEHRVFRDLSAYLRPGDVLVANDSRVIPARLRAVNPRTGRCFEVLLLPDDNSTKEYWTMMRPGRRARVGTQIIFLDHRGAPSALAATVMAHNDEGHRLLRLTGADKPLDALVALGETPLPPYIRRPRSGASKEDAVRYQTVYAAAPGSVAAPTAGLHFTPQLLENLRTRGVRIVHVTLHVGLGTFAPVKADLIAEHIMHEERFLVPAETAREINLAKAEGRRVVAVGTTTLRTLESVALSHNDHVVPGAGRTRIFIHPPFRFRAVDALVTNFHLPCSTLLMLVCAFAAPGDLRGREAMLALYAEAVRRRYRFFSYGDAMLIL